MAEHDHDDGYAGSATLVAGPMHFIQPASFLTIPAHTSRLLGREMKPCRTSAPPPRR